MQPYLPKFIFFFNHLTQGLAAAQKPPFHIRGPARLGLLPGAAAALTITRGWAKPEPGIIIYML